MKHTFQLIVIISLAALTGCSILPKPYRMEIQQGNILSQESIDALTPGMQKQEVVALLGTPMLKQTINANQVDYIYYVQTAGKIKEHSHMRLNFVKGSLNRISGDFKPQGVISATES